MTIRAKFKGRRDDNGAPLEYLQGIPARDLDEDEDWENLSTEDRELVRKSDLYDVKTDREMRSKSSSRSDDDDSPPSEDEPLSADMAEGVAVEDQAESGGGGD